MATQPEKSATRLKKSATRREKSVTQPGKSATQPEKLDIFQLFRDVEASQDDNDVNDVDQLFGKYLYLHQPIETIAINTGKKM